MNTYFKNAFIKILVGMLIVLALLLLFKSGYVAGKWFYQRTGESGNTKINNPK